MHEIGDGIAQDFHLAKRYYDQAADFDSKARIPRNIALRILEVFIINLHCQLIFAMFGEF